ncbi:protein spinster isoform X2 [Drosophila busckii]|uniref:protein spinster isoform X2 n=1 Tax=Drosophila busckii TaxID=30019 RepID=UPI00083F198C|nr:protein spinster isoform X2 [Drosophila busckii]
MSQKHQQAYQPLPTAVAAMDNPAMSNSSSSSGSNDDVAGLAPSGLPATYSSQQLVSSDSDSMEERQRLRGGDNIIINAPEGRPSCLRSIGHSQWFTVGVLCFVNLINYMDRFTIAGVLVDVQSDFNIDNDSAGLLQTAFVISYMICAPVFGYLGDRYSRRWIMAVGVFLWSTTTLLGSFMHQFGWFITFRALVGIGEASYSTIAPTIISDLFVNDMRSKMLAMFYFAIPVGSGLGYIVGSKTAHFANNWRWALRVTPVLGIAAVVLILMLKDPKRGQSEGATNVVATSYCEDIKDLLRNRSFMLSTAGFTCVAFVAGALAWWGPTFIHAGMKMQPGNENLDQDEVAFKFGVITMIAGLIGVPLGAILSQYIVKRLPTADPVICAFGLLLSAPLLTGACLLVSSNSLGTYFLIFFGQLALNLNWAIVADILLYVVVPARRSTAEAFQILISHALGDAGSPYLVGAISVAIKNHLRLSRSDESSSNKSLESLSLTLGNATESVMEAFNSTAINNTSTDMPLRDLSQKAEDSISFEALQYSLFSTTFVEVLGGIFFLITACFILKDKFKATRATLAHNLNLAPTTQNKNNDIFDSDCLVMCTDIALRERELA